MARVSVVVYTTDAKEAVFNTVESILTQTCTDFDLLITDDGSADGTGLELLVRFGPDASRAPQVWRDTLKEEAGTRSIQMLRHGTLIHYLHQVANRGMGTAFNRAIGFATGEWIAFAQAGDTWRPKKLQTQLDIMEAHPDMGACLESQDPRKVGKKSSCRKRALLTPIDFEEILECPGLRLNGSLLRRNCIEGGDPPFDENLPGCEEYDFWLRIAARFSLGRMEEPLQSCRHASEAKEWGQERFRVYALEKAYQGGHLTPTLRHRVAEELVRQCDQLVEDYRGRENHERANFYDRKRKRFSGEVAKLNVSDPVFTGSGGGRGRLAQAAPI